jgi:hypothetical protein
MEEQDRRAEVADMRADTQENALRTLISETRSLGVEFHALGLTIAQGFLAAEG